MYMVYVSGITEFVHLLQYYIKGYKLLVTKFLDGSESYHDFILNIYD